MRRIVPILLVAGVAAWSPRAVADDVVHFTNGAEMAVRSHAIEKDMVKLDLGGSSSISFPVSMVTKIVSAGKNVFLNPVYYPSNQALEAVAATDLPAPLPDRNGRGAGGFVGYRRGQSASGTGLMLGEAANNGDGSYSMDSGRVTTVGKERASNFTTPRPRGYDVLHPPGVGERATMDAPRYTDVQMKVEPRTISLRPDNQLPPAPPPATEGGGEQAPDGTQQAPPPPPPESD